MECSEVREAVSARLDGEAAPADAPPNDAPPNDADVTAHLRTCPACRHFLEHARSLDVVTHAAHAVSSINPDVSAQILESARRERHHLDPWTTTLRLGLVAVALAQLALAVPGLIYGSDEGAPIHIAHEVGAWDLALAIGFVFAAWRPLRAVGMLPFAAALSAGLLFTAVLDVMHGEAVALTETTHLLELVGTALLYLLMAPRRARTRSALRLM
jgi:predicted anti-sigma-YlaC factor YlaD